LTRSKHGLLLVGKMFVLGILIQRLPATFNLILTAFISTGAMFAAMNQPHPLAGYAIGYGVWALFFWGRYRRNNN